AALRELGVLPDDLRLVIVQNEKREIGHAVVAVRYEQRWLILDNRTMSILDADDVRDYRPLFALDQQGTRAVATAGLSMSQIDNLAFPRHNRSRPVLGRVGGEPAE